MVLHSHDPSHGDAVNIFSWKFAQINEINLKSITPRVRHYWLLRTLKASDDRVFFHAYVARFTICANHLLSYVEILWRQCRPCPFTSQMASQSMCLMNGIKAFFLAEHNPADKLWFIFARILFSLKTTKNRFLNTGREQ